MAPPELTEADFQVFAIEGFAPRMEAFQSTLRPRLVALGEHLAPALAAQVGHPLYVHVARHARRTVHPPPESWCAFAPVARGYKAVAHLAVCVSRGGTHARVVLKDEALAPRIRLAASLDKDARKLARALHALGARDYARWDPSGALPPVVDDSAAALRAVAAHGALKTGSFSLGVAFEGWPGQPALLEAFAALEDVYLRALKPAGRNKAS